MCSIWEDCLEPGSLRMEEGLLLGRELTSGLGSVLRGGWGPSH